MSQLKTRQSEKSVEDFLSKISNEKIKNDCYKILQIMKSITKQEPKIWGDKIIGFGSFHYKSKSGQEGDWYLTGFSPQKDKISIHTLVYLDNFKDLTEKLGKFKNTKSCLYVKSLDDININVLKELIKKSIKKTKETYAV